MKNTPMFKLQNGEIGWKWSPFADGWCSRKEDSTNYGTYLGTYGEWNYNTGDFGFPNDEQSLTIKCREFTHCYTDSIEYNSKIGDNRVSMSCEPYKGINIGCKR